MYLVEALVLESDAEEGEVVVADLVADFEDLGEVLVPGCEPDLVSELGEGGHHAHGEVVGVGGGGGVVEAEEAEDVRAVLVDGGEERLAGVLALEVDVGGLDDVVEVLEDCREIEVVAEVRVDALLLRQHQPVQLGLRLGPLLVALLHAHVAHRRLQAQEELAVLLVLRDRLQHLLLAVVHHHVVPVQAEVQPQLSPRVPLQHLLDRHEVLQRLRHLLPRNVQVPRVDEVVDPLLRLQARLSLRDRVVVVRESQVDPTCVQVNRVP